MPNAYALLADFIVVLHFVYMSFIVGGQVLILLGWPLRWAWIRNMWFRGVHLASIVVVAAEAVAGIVCPLTDWEYQLRMKAGQSPEEGSFVGRWAHRLLFYRFPEEVFTAVYVTFAVLVVATLIAVPPRRKKA